MNIQFSTAEDLLRQFKGDAYLHGLGVLAQVGQVTSRLGRRAVLVAGTHAGAGEEVATVKESLAAAGVTLLGEVPGARPNSPFSDILRISAELRRLGPDVILSFGGGSAIDATKAAEALRTLGGELGQYFGAGLVSATIARSGKQLTPHVAIQTTSGSAAHLTKYANATDIDNGQKMLIVDDAVVPTRPVFDYLSSLGAPATLTADGAMDGLAHNLEVLYGAVGKPHYEKAKPVTLEGIRLILEYLPGVLQVPKDVTGRQALGLATDLGGYAIMLGGTNGGHLTSFSLVDVLTHGRACAIMNPYYTVFFAPAIQEPLRLVGRVFKDAGYIQADVDRLAGRDLGLAVAEALLAFQRRIGFPSTLAEVPGFTPAHIERALAAAKNPALKSKLENMPVALSADKIDEFMGPVLRAAQSGDLSLIKNMT